jgi:hypothetical protein
MLTLPLSPINPGIGARDSEFSIQNPPSPLSSLATSPSNTPAFAF